MDNKILVFGAGISGLTISQELLEKGFEVILIEKDYNVGGMAKSRREDNGVPSEHSWRGFAPFYTNTFEIMKRIPDEDKTVYDNLSVPIEFYLMKDKKSNYKPKMSLSDFLIAFYYGSKYILSDKRKEVYYKTKLIPLLKNKLSKDGYDFLIEFMAGPGYGMEKRDISYGHFFRFLTLSFLYNYSHSHEEDDYYHTDDLWHVSNKPTYEFLFEPWKKYLIKKGLVVYYNSSLVKLNTKDNKILSCIVSDGKQEFELKAKEYVMCINPFDAEKIFQNSNMTKLYEQHKFLTEKTDSNQISFRLGFDKKIKLPKQNIAFVMSDSEFNITWYPQDYHWDKNVKLDNSGKIKSLWSGTIMESYNVSSLYQKKGIKLTKEELIDEIKFQLLRSESLQNLIYQNNNFRLTKEDITYTEIWYEWEHVNDELKQKNKKWVNNISNEEFRPEQSTEYSNLYLGGSHTKTSINIWSMEGAVESGKLVSNLILKKYNKKSANIFNHTDSSFFKPFQYVDNLLYKLKFPNIIDTFFIILLIIVVIIFIYQIKKLTVYKIFKKR